MPDEFLRYTLNRNLLKNLYSVLIAGSENPKHLEIVMWLSNPIETDLAPEEVYEDCYFLKIHKVDVDNIVRYAQSSHSVLDVRGPTLSALIRSSLVPGRARRT
jgi:hypothetical protein